MQKSSIQEALMRMRQSLLFAWVKSNLVGWGVGIVCALFLNQFIATPIKDALGPYVLYDYRLEPLLNGVFFWTTIGLCIGITQWARIKQWNMQSQGWILATMLGWSLLGIAFNYVTDYLVRQISPSRWEMLTMEVIVILLGGMFIGLFQFLAGKEIFSRPYRWILVNALGILALYIIMIGLALVPFAIKSYILKFFYAHDLNVLVEARDLLLLGFLIIALPCVATFTLFMPTGKVLLKYIKTA